MRQEDTGSTEDRPYLARLNFSTALPAISQDLAYSKFSLGAYWEAFSISYALGQFLHGQLADRAEAKRVMLLSLNLSGVMNALFGYADSLGLLVLIWGINGYGQLTGRPSAVKMISDRFRSSHGIVGPLFETWFLAGNIIAWPVIGYIDGIGYICTSSSKTVLIPGQRSGYRKEDTYPNGRWLFGPVTSAEAL